jgi:60kDa lysophospholipase
LGAFRSGNLPPLATIGVEIEVAWHLIRAAPARPLVLRTITDQNVVALRLFPGISSVLLDSFFQPTVKGVVLETYGAGNIPTTREDLLSVLKKATDRGIIIVNCTQCFQGTVTGEYAAGAVLKRVGVISGSDMTPEAALTKLAYLLSQEELSTEQIKSYIGKNIRGELTNKNERYRFSFQEREFVDTIAKVLSQGEQLGINKELSRVMYPVLLCSAGSRGDIEAVERMIGGNISIDMGDYDGRTALHLAAADGQLNMVQFLIDNGADVNVSDRWGATPLQDAIRHHQDDIVKILQAAGGNAQKSGLTRSFCQAVASGKFEEVEAVYAHGANPSEADCDGRTPLHLAASYGFIEIVEFLIKSGARRNMKDRWGATPLDDAKRYNHQTIISILSK